MDDIQIRTLCNQWLSLNGSSGASAGFNNSNVYFLKDSEKLVVNYINTGRRFLPEFKMILSYYYGVKFIIEYDEWSDLYNVDILRYEMDSITERKRVEGLYWDQLVAKELAEGIMQI